jgi:hypothetical protein
MEETGGVMIGARETREKTKGKGFAVELLYSMWKKCLKYYGQSLDATLIGSYGLGR